MKCKISIAVLFLFFYGFVTAQSYVPERNNTAVKVKPVVTIKAYAFNLADIRLTGNSPFKNAMQKDAAYLLQLEPDRLLHSFYKNAGLPVKAEVYGGWEKEGVAGHTLGHYLSACAMFYASTGNPEFKRRVDYISAELLRCQQARKTGYVGAIPNEDSIFGKLKRGEIKSGGFDLNGGWSPWYTVHKVISGLIDAYLYCGNTTALHVATGMADWAGDVLKNLNEAQIQQMLRCEYGGMNDVLANIYSITGNKKYLELSYKFYDDFVMKPLSEKIDPMPGKHSNTQVPKAIGSARQYELTGNERDKTIASFFWQTMVHHHTYVNGGNSNYEYCGEEDKLNDRLSDNTSETCNTYNMLKFTRHLFAWQPSAALGDYYERALYNHILASQNHEDGMMCYFVPLRMGTRKTFSDQFNTFTCCVGTGMENHSKYAENIYAEGKDGSLYVNLFIPSSLNWKARNAIIEQNTNFPSGNKTEIILHPKKKESFAVHIRQPWWAKQTAIVKVNDKVVPVQKDDEGFLTIRSAWKNNDKVSVEFPMELYTESMPDNKDRIALLYGPVLLAGILGNETPDPVYGVPVLMTDNRDPKAWIEKTNSSILAFNLNKAGMPKDVALKPFYAVSQEYYNVYWDFFTETQWQTRQAEYEAEKKKQKEIEDMTIDYFRIGEMQPERDHNLTAGERSYVSDALGINGREARKASYFAFEMKVDSSMPNRLLFVYIGDDKDRRFDIVVDGEKIQTVEWMGGETGKFYNEFYDLPPQLISGKTKITVRVEANYDKTAGRVFGARTVRKIIN
ncbi:MAG: glycoside hydrolase family 127 protein [Chitinophagaceae bacterium]|nr:glycoside hydrolase family 127 protein [Chitinophagaceae bacterium]